MKNQLYSDIFTNLKELEDMNEIEPIYKWNSDEPNSIKNIMKRQDSIMDELKLLAKKHNTLLGRIIKFPMADSYALYVVTKVNKTSVRLTWVNYCDGWQDDRIGYESNIDINYVRDKVSGEDIIEEFFTNKVHAEN